MVIWAKTKLRDHVLGLKSQENSCNLGAIFSTIPVHVIDGQTPRFTEVHVIVVVEIIDPSSEEHP